MSAYRDSVKCSTTSTGTGPFTPGSALTGFQTFTTAYGSVAVNVPVTIAAVDGTGVENGDWMTFLGNWNGTDISVNTVLESSNSNALVNFSAGTKHIYTSIPAKIMNTMADIGEAHAIQQFAYVP